MNFSNKNYNFKQKIKTMNKTKLNLIVAFAFLLIVANSFSQENNITSNYVKDDMTKNVVINQSTTQTVPATDVQNRSVNTVSELINYQAVARDAGGNLMLNTVLTIDFEIRDGAGGTAQFSETQNLNTDDNGVFSAQIGSISSLTNVNWLEIDAWLHVTMNGIAVGETQIASVPSALHSKQSSKVMVYGSGTSNADKMIASHSPGFPNWGLQYSDPNDEIDFVADGDKNLSIELFTGDLTTQGNIEINQTTTSPALNTVYGNSMAIAFGSIYSNGVIETGYGITSVTQVATGEYVFVLDHNSGDANTVVSVTPFTGGFGIPEICGYEPTGENTFTVRIMDTSGTAVSSAFSVVVYGNH